MPKKVQKTTRVSPVNIGFILFAVLLGYIIVVLFFYFKTDKVRGYQVLEGSLSSDNIYEGIALRKETVVQSELAGYVNYFAAEGARVAVGNLVYTVDESGNLLDYMQAEGAGSFSLAPEDLTELRTQIVNYEAAFDAKDFHTVYEFKSALSGTVHKLSNAGILDNIAALSNVSGSTINYLTARDTGIVVYSVDGYETLLPSDITMATFEGERNEKTQMANNALVEAGDAVYKLCTDDNWSIVIPVSAEMSEELFTLEYVRVKFLKNQDVSWGKVERFWDEEGNAFVELQFNNSMQTFCTDRFINIELMLTDESGLKIPVSAIVDRRFFLVPKEYVLTNDSGETFIRKKTYGEDGTETSEVVTVDVYNETETSYYLDDLYLEAGDVLLLENEQDSFTVSSQETLTGVFNINKGYADFKRINVLYQNDEYAIVESNTRYGLNAYDYIVLEAQSVQENEMIYN